MIRSIALGLVAGVLVSGAALGGAADTQAALNACASGYPDGGRIAAALGAAGFDDLGRIEAQGQGLHMFVSADGTTYTGTDGTGGVQCVIVENKLKPKRAEAMADALARLMPGAAEMPSPKAGGLDVTRTVAGMFKDRMTVLMVVKSYTFKDVKGAALLVVSQ